MSSIKNLNESLYRKINSGLKYDKYFKSTDCNSTYLGKGSTSYGLQQMKLWTLKNVQQTKKISKVLKASSVPGTIKNIKDFLFNHIQYSADGLEQNLRSPNCSWQSRNEGVDCKTFSSFAMSILMNLNIKGCKFRKITQPSSPESWSHVYVVVDYNGEELVIDATVPYNYEPLKVKQEDLEMESNLKYFGLNAVANSTTVNKKTLELDYALKNFNRFLDDLENRGVNKTITDRIWNTLKVNLANGIEPYVDIKPSYISINDVKISFFEATSGLGFVDPATVTAITSIFSSGIFGSMFSSPDSKGLTHIVEPLGKHVTEKLQSATPDNLHLVLTDLDKHINATISHETYVNSRFGQVAIPKLKEMLNTLREGYKQFPSTQKTSTQSYPDYWYGGVDNLKHSGSYKHLEYSKASLPNPSSNPLTFPSGSGTGGNNKLSDLIEIATGIFKDNQTGEILTQEQVNQIQYAPTQNAQGGQNNESGMSTGVKIAIGTGVVGVIGVATYFILKK